MRELDRDAAKIVPDSAKNNFNLRIGFFRKCGAQVFAAQVMFLEQWAYFAHQRAGKVRRALAIEAFDRVDQSDRARAGQGVDQWLEAPSGHQKLTMILPNTCRLSSLARPRSKSASATSVSITGVSPDAILARLSRMLRIEQPNEPKMRYCCK